MAAEVMQRSGRRVSPQMAIALRQLLSFAGDLSLESVTLLTAQAALGLTPSWPAGTTLDELQAGLARLQVATDQLRNASAAEVTQRG